MEVLEKTCENCKYEAEDMDGIHCMHCIHNASENFEPKETSVSEQEIRNKAIDEFIKALNDCDRYCAEQITHCLSENVYTKKNEVFVVDDIYEIAEEMKVGGKNEID